MPKNFPFYNLEEHQRIIRALEGQAPAAIIAATTRDPAMMGGGVYSFPLFVDGDFAVPSVYMTAEEGSRLAGHLGQRITLASQATRISATGCNIIAGKGGRSGQRIVVFAHIDAWLDTPGAGDNASGTVVLLLLAELLTGYTGSLGIELVARNGEDYYANPGEQQWLALNAGRFSDILLGINVDDVDYYKGKVGFRCTTARPMWLRSSSRPLPPMMAWSPASPGIRGIMGSSCATRSPLWRSRRISWRN